MEMVKSLEASLEKIVLDPKYHDILMLVKAVRNGIVYGAKIRFPHALVYVYTSCYLQAPLRLKGLLTSKLTV